MGFLKNLFKKKNDDFFPPEEEIESWEEVVYKRDDLDIHDPAQRREYVQGCLEQISEAAKEVESLSYEYNVVTGYLQDMEEIDALPAGEKKLLEAAATKVSRLQEEKASFQGRTSRMSDAQFHKIERLQDEVEEGLKKLQEAEDYQVLVKKDLSRLDAERQAFKYRKYELLDQLEQSQVIAVACTIMAGIALFVLLALQLVLELDTIWALILAAGLAALVYVFSFVRHHDAVQELKKLEKDNNRLILLQNKVKIRYVNNTNLLDYLYMKYQVNTSKELQSLKDAYEEEKEARENYRRAQFDLDENEQELLKLLRRYRIKDPTVWLHQTDALLDKKEMVEIRHGLIVRRQALRKRMDYNRDTIAGSAQKEIKDLVDSYPRYAKEILGMVDKYM